MFVYERTLLEGYDKTQEVIEGIDSVFLKTALTPYRRGLSALNQAEELIAMIEKKQRLIDLYYDIKESLDAIKPKFKRILGERYGFMGDGVSGVQDRNYYRKLLLSTDKFAKAMADKGYTAEKYAAIVKEFHFLDEIFTDKLNSEKRAAKIGKLRSAQSLKAASNCD